MLFLTLFLFAPEDQILLQNLDLFQPLSSNQVAGSPEGTLFILDSEGSKVLPFSMDGKPLPSFGGSGQGPGEFEWPSKIEFYNDQIIVYSLMACHFFKPDGTFVSKVNTKSTSLPVRKGVFEADFPAAFVETPANLYFLDSENPTEKKALLQYDRIPLNRFPAPNREGGMNIVPALDFLHLIRAGDARHVYFYPPGQRKIHILDGNRGTLLDSLELPEPPTFNTAWGESEYAKAKTSLQQRSRNSGREITSFTVYLPEAFPALRRMRVLDGLLHVTLWSGSPGEDKPVIAFDHKGARQEARFSADELESIATLHEGRAWMITWDPEEGQAGLISLPRDQVAAYVAAHPPANSY